MGTSVCLHSVMTVARKLFFGSALVCGFTHVLLVSVLWMLLGWLMALKSIRTRANWGTNTGPGCSYWFVTMHKCWSQARVLGSSLTRAHWQQYQWLHSARGQRLNNVLWSSYLHGLHMLMPLPASKSSFRRFLVLPLTHRLVGIQWSCTSVLCKLFFAHSISIVPHVSSGRPEVNIEIDLKVGVLVSMNAIYCITAGPKRLVLNCR